jgi:hypothetical protein
MAQKTRRQYPITASLAHWSVSPWVPILTAPPMVTRRISGAGGKKSKVLNHTRNGRLTEQSMAKRNFVVCSRMDPERLKQYLQQTEQNIAQGNRHVAEQHALVARLEQQGHDAASARALLALLEESLRLHMAERDRLLRELGELFPQEHGL